MLRPTTSPTAIHHCPRLRSTARMVNKMTAGHTRRSRVAVSSTWPNSSGSNDDPYAQAQRLCARRPPPSSRAISVTTTIDDAMIAVAGMRTAHTASATTVLKNCAINGVSGGWSTYPHWAGSIAK